MYSQTEPLVPEGLQITITLSLALSSLAMAKRNVIVKRLSSVETLGSATVICSDKTGTITTGQMTVRKIWIGGHIIDVTGEGYEPEGSIFLEGNNVNFSNREDFYKLCQVATLDNKATLVPPIDRKNSRWTALGDSTDAALLVLAAKAGIQYKQELHQNPRIGMIPFESIRKMMTSIHKGTDGKITAYTKGAGNGILSKCTSVYWNTKVLPLTDELSKQIRTEIDALARQPYRVLALAVRDLPNDLQKFDATSVENTLTFIGLVAIYDPPRRDVPSAVQKAQNAGVRIIMMTGDHELTAILTGDGKTGATLVRHDDVDKVAFTGSTEVGKDIQRAVAGTGKKLTLELGGKAANIVFDDAPLDQAVEGIINGIYFNQGEVCCAGSRLLVQESIYELLIAKLKNRMGTLRVGDPLDKNTDIGAINSREQLDRITELVESGREEGAEIFQPACRLPEKGYWFPPTVFTNVAQSYRIAQEEIFTGRPTGRQSKSMEK